MKNRDIAPKASRIFLSLALALALSASTLGCGGSDIKDFDPTQIAAHFAVYQQTTQTAPDQLQTTNVAAAVFYQGVVTVRLESTLVEIVDPTGAAHAMDPASTPTGQFYYSVTLPELQLNRAYTFRVTLNNGTVISNSITTPQNPLAITQPALHADIDKNSYVDVGWTGNNPGKNATIVFKHPSTLTILNPLYAVIVISVSDNGLYRISPASDGMEQTDTGAGLRMLTVTRRNNSGVNGFHPLSFCLAALISARQVNLTE